MPSPAKKKTGGKSGGNGSAGLRKKANGRNGSGSGNGRGGNGHNGRNGRGNGADVPLMRSDFDRLFHAGMKPYVKMLRGEIRAVRRETVADVRKMIIPALAKVGQELRETRAEIKRDMRNFRKEIRAEVSAQVKREVRTALKQGG